MRPSPHNIVSEVIGSDKFIVVNVLSGHADLLTRQELNMLKRFGESPPKGFIDKGYIADPEEEQQRYRMAYIDFLEQRDKEELQLFFVPTYLCNFECDYCYQAPYLTGPDKLSVAVIDSFFSYLQQHMGHRSKYITLFGGEPLLPGKEYKESLSFLLHRCAEHRLDLAVVTNGYHLDEYLDLLSGTSIREIQVTLDGTEENHNRRRPHKGGKATFHRIVSAIDQCIKYGLQVNLRMVVDKENINDLPGLARYAIDKGWTESPFFKTQLGRNYELHHCHSGHAKLYSRLSLYEDLFYIIDKYPEILLFHRPAFSVARFLKDNGSLPPPLFDACPACKGEWAFDHRGIIYGCTATVGKPGEELGRFYPDIHLDQEKVHAWQQRDVCSIKACRQCNLQLVCGGGCGAVAKNTKGNIHEADCRPVKELLGMGIATYF